MKKIIAFLLVAIMALSLAACGSKETPNNTDNTNNQTQTENSGTNESTPINSEKEPEENFDLKTVDGLLATFGFSAKDFESTKDFDRIDAADKNLSTGEISSVAICYTTAKTTDETNEWKAMLVDLIKSKSDDGKAYGYSITKGLTSEEFTADSFENGSNFIGYTYKGKDVVISATFYPNDLDGFALLSFEFVD